MVNSMILGMFIVIGWYSASFFTDMMNKKVQQQVRMPATLTFVQFMAGGICSALILRVLKLHPYQSLRTSEMRQVFPIAMCWTVGFLTTNFSLGKTAVSFAHAVKATEPLFLVAVSVLFFSKHFTSAVYASLLPIAAGIALVAMTDVSFALSGFLAVCLSNCCFTTRSILAKDLFAAKVVNKLNLFYYISWFSACMTLPIAVYMEGSLVQDQLNTILSGDLLTKIILNGVLHYTYNQLSFLFLGLVTPLTHSVVNAARRFVIIMGSVIYFGTSLTTLNIVGIACLLIGVFSYVYARSLEGKRAKSS